MIVTTNRD